MIIEQSITKTTNFRTIDYFDRLCALQNLCREAAYTRVLHPTPSLRTPPAYTRTRTHTHTSTHNRPQPA
jgi:hypothetical protein